VNLIVAVVAWFLNPANWQGPNGVPIRIGEHLLVSGFSLAVAALIALPAGVALGHSGRGGFLALNVANVGRALPSLAILAFTFPIALRAGLGFGFWPTVFAMVPLAIPPMLTNSYVAMREVDPDAVETARGMGMQGREVLREVELPLALPLIIAGVRNAAVAVVATATLGAIVAGGGLGRYLVDGMALQQYDRLLAGALLVALLSVVTEIGLSAIERAAVSPGIRAGIGRAESS
jgi:osmoprotectant transport system permease protein